MEDIPSIPTASAVSVPASSSSPNCSINYDKASGKPKAVQSLPFTFSNNKNNNQRAKTHDSQNTQSSNSTLAPKSHNLIGSLSFNRGNTSKPSIHNHSASVIRAASFQGRSNPHNYSTGTEQGSDNDSLYSSSSSLDCTAGWGSITPTKPGLHLGHLTQKGYNHTKSPTFPQHLNKDIDPNPRKSSSHGTVFNSEMSDMFGMKVPRPVNTDFVPSFDLQCQGGGGMVDVQCGRNHKYTTANFSLNGDIQNAGFLGEEVHTCSKNYKQQEPVTFKLLKSRTQGTSTRRLNKFPLDLESLVSGPPSIAPSTEAQKESLKPQHPKLSWSCSDSQNQISPPSTSVSPSASLSSLDSSSDTPPPLALHYPFLPFVAPSSSSSTSLKPAILPEICYSPLAMCRAQTSLKQQIPTGLQDGASKPPQHPLTHGPSQSIEDRPSDAQNGSGSVTQSTASFSMRNKTIPAIDTLLPAPHVKPITNWKDGTKKQSGKSNFLSL